jgi:aspartate kinase
MSTLVMKFGGRLLTDAKSIARVAQVILAETLAWKRMVVVISAMAGVTDTLNQAADLAAGRNATGYRRAVAGLRVKHLGVIEALLNSEAARRDLTEQLDRVLFDVLSVCDVGMTSREVSPRDRDSILAAGERLIVDILTAFVRQEGLRTAAIDATSLIVTDERHLNANPLIDLVDERVDRVLRPLLDAGIVPLVTGFIGETRNGVVTTLGRGGSDFTATILAASLHADEVWMWTNVDGVMSADPALVPGARVIPALSYEEVGELSYFGAHILHPRAVEPLLPHRIPLRVRNPFNLDHAGTLIQAETDETSAGLKAVTAADGLYLTISGQPIDITEFLERIRQLVGQMTVGPVIVMQSYLRTTLVFIVSTTAGPTALGTVIQRLSAELGSEHWEFVPVKVIAVMGAMAQSALFEPGSGIHPLATAVGPGDRCLIAVAPPEVGVVVRQLHKLTNQAMTSSGAWLA